MSDRSADLLERFARIVDDATLAMGISTVAAHLRSTARRSAEVIDRLQSAFGLSSFERDLLLLVGLPEEHEFVTHAARRHHPLGEPRFSFGMLAETLELDTEGREFLREALESGPLHTHRLVIGNETIPLPERGQRLMHGLWNVIRGTDHWPDGIEPVKLRSAPMASAGPIDGARLRAALAAGPSVVLVTGAGTRPPHDLAASLITALQSVASNGHGAEPLSFFDATCLRDDVPFVISAHAAARGTIPVVIGQPEAPPFPLHPGPVVVCVTDATGLPLDDRSVVSFDLGDRSMAENISMWTSLAPELNGEATQLAGLLRIDQLRAAQAVADARATAQSNGHGIDVTSIVTQVRRRTGVSLPNSVQLVRPVAQRDTLITTPENDDLLTAVVDRVHGQVQVLHEWGFAETRNVRGVRAMFSGPPGTGKTLSAEIVAASLGLDLLIVDLSALVSKWLGETEKNISEVFDAAERCQSVLFFDEADAIFAKRTDSSDAQGRWANLETAHLLTRMEAFGGLAILATNLRANIDEAFVRRLDVIVEFEEPGVDERRRLWAGHIPGGAPLAADVDLNQLASLYEITGGLIRNAALDAAFRAAAAGCDIDQRGLIRSVEREYQKGGRSFPGTPRGLTAAASTNSSTGGA